VIRLDPDDVVAARSGDRAALAAVLRSVEPPIYNLSLRMLAHPADAEDATQEILIKIVTHLGGLMEVQAAGAWAMRIATRHLVEERKRSRVEAMRLTFEGFAQDLDLGQAPLADAEMNAAEEALAVEEVKIGCTLALLTCLSRDLRMTYLLSDVFELPNAEAAEILAISPAAYRQRLKRARQSVTAFTQAHCGIVSDLAPCRCDRRVAAALQMGRIAKGASVFGRDTRQSQDLDSLQRQVRRLEEGRATATLMRSNPAFQTQIRDLVLSVLDPQIANR